MINLCKDCPNPNCKTLCKEAYKFTRKDTFHERRGKGRKMLFGFDMDRFPDVDWWEGFTYKDGAVDVDKFINLLTPRQLRIWEAIQDWMNSTSKGKDFRAEIANALGISRWAFNRELRRLREKAKDCILEGL